MNDSHLKLTTERKVVMFLVKIGHSVASPKKQKQTNKQTKVTHIQTNATGKQTTQKLLKLTTERKVVMFLVKTGHSVPSRMWQTKKY